MMMHAQQWLLFFGALLGFLGVALGAFGAHALKQKLSLEMLTIFEVGVRYQMYHALAILFVALAMLLLKSPWLPYAGWSFVVGTIIFSGSLYILALSGVKAWGAVTPVGGLVLLLGWLFLAVGALSRSQS
jgi:Uncharacterized small membrane protein